MNKKKLIDLYKKQLAQSSEKAPEGLWDDIAKEMDENQLISQYKEELAQSAEKAPIGLWDDISRKMDLDEVWEGVATGLDEEKRKGGFWWFNRGLAAAIAILLVSSLSVWFAGNLSSPDAEFAVAETELTSPAHEGETEETSEAPITTRQPEFTIAITGSNGKEETIQEIAESAIASLQQHDDTFQEDSTSRTILPGYFGEGELASVDFLYGLGAKVATSNQPAPVLDVPEPVLSTNISHNIRHVPPYASGGSFALGFTTAMKNTWLFNHETFQGFSPGSGSRTNVQIYPDIAVSLRYLLSERWKMESSLSFSSSAGQSYEQYIYGRYSQREIALNYFHAEVLAGYNHRKRWVVRSNAISHSTSVGLYYGALNAARESIAGEKTDVSTLYRNDDYGIVTGHNLNIPVIGNLVFSPGMYITWGLPNIYQGEYTLPSIKRTHNRSVELRFSLYYNFSR